jgi:hypothetical protein
MNPEARRRELDRMRTTDSDADRKAVDSALLDAMSRPSLNGKASIDIDVSKAVKGGGGDDEKALFNTPRSKSVPQMPNTATNTIADKSAGSGEGESAGSL